MTIGMPRWSRSGLAALLLILAPLSAALADTAKTDARLDLGLLSIRELRADPSRWIVLDARPVAAFREGHLPNAHSFSWEDHTRNDERGVPYQPWPPEELASAFAAMGMTESSAVVVYGDADKSWGGEGWTCWVLEWLGHQGPVRLLDGGIESWTEAGMKLETTEQSAAPAHYAVHLRAPIDVPLTELRANAESFCLIDTRSDAEWALGRIPGAIHIPWDEFHQGDDRRPVSGQELRALLREHGVSLDRPVVYYCAGGIRSAYAWLVHELSGLPPARNYEGGMEEWKRVN